LNQNRASAFCFDAFSRTGTRFARKRSSKPDAWRPYVAARPGQCIKRGAITDTVSNTPRQLTADNFIRTVFASVIGNAKKNVIARTIKPSSKYMLDPSV
jgi:hypothetical protein